MIKYTSRKCTGQLMGGSFMPTCVVVTLLAAYGQESSKEYTEVVIKDK